MEDETKQIFFLSLRQIFRWVGPYLFSLGFWFLVQIGWSNLKHSDRAGDYLPQTDFNLRSIQDFQASISFNEFVLDYIGLVQL